MVQDCLTKAERARGACGRRHRRCSEPLDGGRTPMSNIDRRTASLLGLAAVLAPAASRADEIYPARPVHLIVGFTPGASSDIVARLYASGASPILGQDIVVENKPGAGSSIAAGYVARAAKDGYTLFLPALSSLTYQIV